MSEHSPIKLEYKRFKQPGSAIWALALGCVLLLISLPTISLVIVEEVSDHRAGSNYEIAPLWFETNLQFGNHMVAITRDKSLRHMPVSVIVDNQVVFPSSALSKTNSTHDTEACILIDKLSGARFLSMVTRYGTSFEIIRVPENGSLSTETFSFAQRRYPLYRTMLINLVTPEQTGYYSNVEYVYPMVGIPFTYPFGTLVFGILLLAYWGLIARRRAKKVNITL